MNSNKERYIWPMVRDSYNDFFTIVRMLNEKDGLYYLCVVQRGGPWAISIGIKDAVGVLTFGKVDVWGRDYRGVPFFYLDENQEPETERLARLYMQKIPKQESYREKMRRLIFSRKKKHG